VQDRDFWRLFNLTTDLRVDFNPDTTMRIEEMSETDCKVDPGLSISSRKRVDIKHDTGRQKHVKDRQKYVEGRQEHVRGLQEHVSGRQEHVKDRQEQLRVDKSMLRIDKMVIVERTCLRVDKNS